MAAGCVKVTLIKAHRRSRGRIATRTYTLMRGVRHHAERADLLTALADIVPMIDGTPTKCSFNGETYEIERFESRKEHGVRRVRAHFVGERDIFRERAKRLRKLRRAEKRAHDASVRSERRKRAARFIAIFRNRRSSAPAYVLIPAAAYSSSSALGTPYDHFTIFPHARGAPDKNIQKLGS